MTKEQWKIIRSMEEIPIFVWHEYYMENGGVIKDIGVFENMFYKILAQPLEMVKSDGSRRHISFTTAVNRLIGYYQNKFPDE